MTKRKAITQDYLKSILDYDPETGLFTWLIKPICPHCGRGPTSFNSRFAGKRAGKKDPTGYVYILVDGKGQLAHRIAFLYMTGKIPALDIDHINGVRNDNRWGNLRAATRSQNLVNTGNSSRNTSGHRGVFWHEAMKGWRVTVQYEKRNYHVGYFKNYDDAVTAYRAKAKELFGTFARFD